MGLSDSSRKVMLLELRVPWEDRTEEAPEHSEESQTL